MADQTKVEVLTMGRIRSIKPEFPHSESVGNVSRDARLLFIQLWTLADDSGRTRAASRMLASLLYPYDNDAPKLIDGWLAELESQKCIVRYVVNRDHYLEVCNWSKHQKIDKPSKSKIPPFDESSRGLDESSRTFVVGLDQGSRIKEGIKDQGMDQTAPAALPPPSDSRFEEFWQVYDKKVGRPKAETAWRNAKFKAEHAAVIEAARAYVGSTPDKAFRKHATTWIHQRGWEDEVVVSNGAKANGVFQNNQRVQHPSSMPVPFNSPLGDCQCNACTVARAKKSKTTT